MRIPAYILLLTLIIGIYFYRYQNTRPIYKEGDRIRITSRISEDPSIEGYQQKINIEGLKIYIDRFPEYSYGDYVSAEGIVAKGISGFYLKDPKINKISEQGYFLTLREKVLSIYSAALPEPHNGLLSGIVLGTKSSLDASFNEKLRDTGTIHIVVASGTNISIFAGIILFILINLVKANRRLAIAGAFIFIWAYIFFIGFQPPIVRAGIMASIVFVAGILGREGDSLRALFIAAAIMLLFVPSWLFDLGFQLSFLATLGIILLGKRFSQIGERIKRIPVLVRETLAMTLAAQVAVLPLIIYKFGSFPLISPLVNLLVVPIVPFIMVLGFILGIIGLISPISQILGWIIFIPLEYFVRVINIFS